MEGRKMLCKSKEDSQCCLKPHKEKVQPCILIALSVLVTIAGFIIGHCVIGKCCHKLENQKSEE
jgi:hypothetical protein